DVQLIKDEAGEGQAAPARVSPRVQVVVDDLGEAEHTVRLRSRAWVGSRLGPLDREAVARPRTGRRIWCLPPATLESRHRRLSFVRHQVDPVFVRRPDLEPMHRAYGGPAGRPSTATGKWRMSSATGMARPPFSSSPVRRLLQLPAGSSTVVSAQSPPSPATSLGTTTSRRSRTKTTACRDFVTTTASGVLLVIQYIL